MRHIHIQVGRYMGTTKGKTTAVLVEYSEKWPTWADAVAQAQVGVDEQFQDDGSAMVLIVCDKDCL